MNSVDAASPVYAFVAFTRYSVEFTSDSEIGPMITPLWLLNEKASGSAGVIVKSV